MNSKIIICLFALAFAAAVAAEGEEEGDRGFVKAVLGVVSNREFPTLTVIALR